MKTQIVCTIGPSTWDQEIMTKMAQLGMRFARVNGAFADIAELDKVAALARGTGLPIDLMLDVKGPEVRMNKFPAPIPLQPGQEIIFGNDSTSEIYPANYSNLYTKLTVGQRVVIGDGDVELKIDRIENDKMICKVVYGELLKPGKAMNLPGANYASEVLTPKDKENIAHAIATGWEYVSVSFVQNAAAAREIKSHLGDKMKLIAKIEDQAGIDNMDEILPEVWGIMVARGGLGVELGLENVPARQKLIVEKTKAAGKYCIVATQMLESMIENPRPTRAEMNDVATAVWQGADATMLSGETSAGKYPVQAVEWMGRAAQAAEVG